MRRERKTPPMDVKITRDADPWLIDWQDHGLAAEAAISRFLSLPAMEVEDMVGRWSGSELTTSHPLDGMLPKFGWYGKWFLSAEEGHPLMMKDVFGFYPLNPFFIPLRLIAAQRWLFDHAPGHWLVRNGGRLFAASRPKARLRPVALGGTVSAAMIYDEKPIVDHFRRIDGRRCLGLMDYRDFDRPFFFLLTREDEIAENTGN
ncbi:DUF4334 domain-containing protein [Rhizobium paknamense]|uniref:DUF4334 domain-containing protein n=1 Tax=Rhizobium paknamense TaxID=1206817 RepID=A0ABU0IBI0_9HYPH|nr:DUF4334 domain-containing protein [Rhizobium paknamense]MDQ0455582.1 hypothetical protein [Rhizobium paknamense]